MNKPQTIAAILFLGLTASLAAQASDKALVMGLFKAEPSENLYKVEIDKIDGKQPMSRVEYPLEPGEHTISVNLVLDAQWVPQLQQAMNYSYTKEVTFTAEAGKKYEIGAKVDPSANSKEQIANGDFWTPVVQHQTD